MTGYPSIGALLPHTARAILLDEVVSVDERRIVCRVSIRDDSAFLEDGLVPAVVVLEYMAQTIGALAGLRARATGEPPRVGFLLGTRDLTLAVEGFAVGDDILVEARQVFGDEAIGSFDCSATRASVSVAAGTLNVFLPPKQAPSL